MIFCHLHKISDRLTKTDGNGGNLTVDIYSIAELESFLLSQPVNTTCNIKLNVSDLGGASYTAGSVGSVFYANKNKYVNLDLSGSTFTSIGASAFSGSGLTSVTIPNSVTSIGESAFYGSGLTSITIPGSVTSFTASAFKNCTNLASIIIENNLTKSQNDIFENCTSLTSVTIRSSVTDMYVYDFSNCTNITSVTFEKPGINIRNAFPSSDNLKTAYSTGGIGTYTRPNTSSTTWTKISS